MTPTKNCVLGIPICVNGLRRTGSSLFVLASGTRAFGSCETGQEAALHQGWRRELPASDCADLLRAACRPLAQRMAASKESPSLGQQSAAFLLMLFKWPV
jgi:hypothetical protein